MNYKVILFYKYIKIKDPSKVMKKQKEICSKLGLKGRTIIAKEGINSTLGGTKESILKYIEYMKYIPEFKDIHFKISDGNKDDFPKLSIKVRPEIVSLNLGQNDIDPTKITGEYLHAEELHNWFKEGKEFYIVDMRNSYEYEIGHFKNSIDPGMDNFRDLPEVLPKIQHLKEKVIVTVCTGGIRCEKASGFLMSKGFKNVYQLYGGMQVYMQKYPADDFLGKLYVFDGRVAVDFTKDRSKHVIVGRCSKCSRSCENYVNCGWPRCNKHFICCEGCKDNEFQKYFCSSVCKSKFVNAYANVS